MLPHTWVRTRVFPSLYLWDESFPADLGKPGVCFEGGEVFLSAEFGAGRGGGFVSNRAVSAFWVARQVLPECSEHQRTAAELSKLREKSHFFGRGQHLLLCSSSPLWFHFKSPITALVPRGQTRKWELKED